MPTPTPTPIANLPLAPSLVAEDLFITEYHGLNDNNEPVAETQQTTLQDISDWICGNQNNTFNIKPEQVLVFGANTTRQVENNVVTIGFKIPNWTQGTTYNKDDIVKYEGCYYQCLVNTSSNLASSPDSIENEWSRIGYKIGRRLSLSEDNTLTGLGIEIWQAGTEYAINDFVYNQKRLYKCIVANTDTEWDETHWENIGEGNGIIPYTNNRDYDVGAIVVKDGKLYQRNSNGQGIDLNWVPNNWTCISNGNYANVFIVYANSIPTSTFSPSNATTGDYMGVCVGQYERAPTDPNAYHWTKIKGEVNIEGNMIVINMTLLASDWSGTAPYSQTISNNILTADMYPYIDIVLSDDSEDWEDELLQYSYLTRAVCTNGSITFYCKDEVPTEDINLKLRLSGDTLGSTYALAADLNALTARVLALENSLNNGSLNNELEATLTGGNNG